MLKSCRKIEPYFHSPESLQSLSKAVVGFVLNILPYSLAMVLIILVQWTVLNVGYRGLSFIWIYYAWQWCASAQAVKDHCCASEMYASLSLLPGGPLVWLRRLGQKCLAGCSLESLVPSAFLKDGKGIQKWNILYKATQSLNWYRASRVPFLCSALMGLSAFWKWKIPVSHW